MATKQALVKHIKGVTFAGKTDSNHWVMMDGPESFGGSDAAIRPKELLLLALGGCTGSDVITILEKKRIKVESFDINLTAEMQETHPQVYTKINIEYVFKGSNIPEKDVERAIELSQDKYCSVTAMLQKAVEITHSFRIIE
ncbi:MAG TPA: OsmC family protein [Melioribacteraceae bacterium]|nr:OsmC family protein [Melioribacteraceae bacterium]